MAIMIENMFYHQCKEGNVSMNPIVSVIVPTYRREKALEEALLSLCKQDYSPIELIVVDDNADAEWEITVTQIVHRIKTNLPSVFSIQLITNSENKGAAQSRNIGIYAAKGTYITFLDDDDVYLPEKIRIQLNAMLESSADYSLMNLTLINEQKQVIKHKTHPYLETGSDREELIRLHLLHHLTGTDTMMFKKDYLLQIGAFGSIDIGDEFYLMMHAIEHGGRFVYVPQMLVHAMVHFDRSGLSSGPLKLEGENQLFHFKKSYFGYLSRQEKQYVRMRHHAVIAFAHLKARHFIRFMIEALKGFLIYPSGCLKMLLMR